MIKNHQAKYLVFLRILSLFMLASHSYAQRIDHYSTSDGLAHKHVMVVHEDSKGYLWIGTWEGLSKFDGHTFTTYRHNPEDSTSISGNEIQLITGDSLGNVWVLSKEGMMRYAEKENNFERVYLRDIPKDSLLPSGLNTLAFDYHGMGWFIDELGLISFSPDLKNIHYIDISELHQNRKEWKVTIVPDRLGLWMAAGTGLFHFTFSYLNNTKVLELSASDSSFLFQENTNPDFMINSFRTSSGEIIIRSDPNDIFITDKVTGTLQPIDLPLVDGSKMEIQNVEIKDEITPGILAFSSNNYGILIYDLNTRQFKFDHPIQQGFEHQTIYVVYPDRQHNIWIGGLDGLYKYTEPQLNFKSWLYDPRIENTIRGASLTSVYVENNHLWLASSGGGVDRINLVNSKVDHLDIPEKYQSLTQGANAYHIFGLDKNRMLINYDSLLFVYDLRTENLNHIGTVDYHIYKICKDREGEIWLSDTQRLYYLSLKKDSFSFSTACYLGEHFRDMLQTKNGDFFLASGNGLVSFDKANSKVMKAFIPPGSEFSPEVFCVHEASDGMLWIGTIHHGIYCFDQFTQKFIRHFDSGDGLIDNSVNVIYGDESGYLWLTTWKGITRFDPISETFQNYSTANGLPFPEFNTGAHFEDDAGNYYFGGVGGVISLHPDKFVSFNIEFTPKITSLLADNMLMKLEYPLHADEIIQVPYNQNSLNIFFNAFDFRNPNQRIYRYRLNGLDNDWRRNVMGNTNARYDALETGVYVFELQSTYKGWEWNDDTQKFLIRVASPPIFQRQSFQILLISLLALLLLSVIFLRVRNASLRKEIIIVSLKKESNKARLDFLKSQMNPHFYFNTLNAINNFVLRSDTRSANKYLTKFAKLMREILENSQKEFVSIEEEIKVLENYLSLQQLRFPDVFDYGITAEDQVKSLSIPPMLIQPFIENAVEYAFAGMPVKGLIDVRFGLLNNNVVCSVTDNGIGIENSQIIKARQKRKSTAIENIRQRIKILNSVYNTSIQIEFNSRDSSNKEHPGTIVKIALPATIYLSDSNVKDL